MEPPATREREWPELHRARRAIVVVDVVESVRLMQEHEAAFIDRWRRLVNEVRTVLLPVHEGRMVKSLGDGMLLEFRTVPQAIGATLALQRMSLHANANAWSAALRIDLRAGVHVSEVVVDELDVYGSGVNLAARLATLAGPGTTVVSTPVRDELVDGLDADIEDLGECFLRHIDAPVRAWRVTPRRGDAIIPAAAREPAAVRADLRPIVAVLPFSGDPASGDRGVIGDVLADEVTVSLSRCAELRVISRMSTAAFKARGLGGPSVRDALQAHFVVGGSYHAEGDAVRLRVELSETEGHEVLWADSLSASAAALLRGDDPAVGRILGGVAAAVLDLELRRATSLPLPNVESHALMSAAITLMHRANAEQFLRARDMIEHLRDRHRTMPQPHAWLAKWHVLRVVQGWSPDPGQDGQLALDAGHRALDGDPASSLALTMQGLVHAYLRRDFDQAGAAYGDALAINPNESLATLLLGTMHAFLGEGEPAWQHAQAAMRLSPLDPLRYFYLSLNASSAIAAGRYGEAIDLAQRSLRANRMHLSTYRALAIAQSLAGELPAARETVQRLLALEPGFTQARFLERYPGRDRAPDYARFLAAALGEAGLPR